MHLKKSVFIVILCLALMVPLVTACSEGGSASSDQTAAPSPPSTKTELLYWPDLNPSDPSDARNVAIAKIDGVSL